jgi:hypothetical protein
LAPWKRQQKSNDQATEPNAHATSKVVPPAEDQTTVVYAKIAVTRTPSEDMTSHAPDVVQQAIIYADLVSVEGFTSTPSSTTDAKIVSSIA